LPHSNSALQALHPFFSRLELAVAWRYFRNRRTNTSAGQSKRNGFVSFISLVSLLGIALGISALIVVTSVMNGFAEETRERLLSASTHVMVTPTTLANGPLKLNITEKLVNLDLGEYASAPYLTGVGMLANGSKLSAVQLHGVLPEQEEGVTRLSNYLRVGKSESLESGVDNILIGSGLAYELGVSVEDEVTLVLPKSNAEGTDFTPKLRRYKVSGVFHFPFPEPNQRFVFMHLDSLAALQSMSSKYQGFRMRLDDAFSAPLIREALVDEVESQNYRITDWTIEQASFFRAIKTERTIMFILLFLIVAVAVFNIISTLMMVVKNKRHDIAILRTLGLSPNSVTQIFFFQGMCISLMGVVLGFILGLLVTLNINTILPFLENTFGFSLFPREMFLINGLPASIDWMQLALVAFIALFLSALAAIYPARKAAYIEPGEALRYE